MQTNSLKFYDRLALKYINQWNYGKRNRVRVSDDLIGLMIRYMATADQNYSEEKSKGLTPDKWRRQAAIFAIRYSLKKSKYDPFSSYNNNIVVVDPYSVIDDPYKNNTLLNDNIKKLKFLIKNSELTKEQINYIEAYLTGRKMKFIAEDFHVSPHVVYYNIKKAIQKMKSIAKGSKK